MAIAGRASVSPRSALIMASPSTSRLMTESNRGLTSTMPRGFFRWCLKHSGLRRKLMRSRHSTLCRTVPGSSAVPFSPQRQRVPSPNAHARTQGTPRERPYCRASSIISAVRRCSSSRPRGTLRCAERCCPSAAQVRRSETCSCARICSSRHSDAGGLEVSPSSLLQNELVQRQIGNRLAQPAVLEPKVLQALHLLGLQPTKLLAPPIIRHLTHADLTDCVHCVLALREQNIDLSQLRDDLFRLVSLPCHYSPP